MDEDDEVKRFVYDGWDICIRLDTTTADGQTSGHADLVIDGEHKCRISLSGRFTGGDNAYDTLERKARAWVDDWKSREHSGDTHFATL